MHVEGVQTAWLSSDSRLLLASGSAEYIHARIVANPTATKISDPKYEELEKDGNMKKIDSFFTQAQMIAACTVIAGCTVASAQQLPISNFERSIAQVVVRHTDGSSKAFGTTFFVRDDGTVATANHVYADAVSYIAHARDGQIALRRALRGSTTGILANVDLVSTDSSHDPALLRVHDFKPEQWTAVGGTKTITLSQKTELANDSHLVFVGYLGEDILPGMLPATLSGTTTIIIPQLGNTAIEEFLVSAFALPGHSGSPLLLDGEVIGIVDSMVTTAVGFSTQPVHAGLSRVVKVEHLRSLLSTLK